MSKENENGQGAGEGGGGNAPDTTVDYAKLAAPGTLADAGEGGDGAGQGSSGGGAGDRGDSGGSGAGTQGGGTGTKPDASTGQFGERLLTQLKAKYGFEGQLPDGVSEDNFLDTIEDLLVPDIHPEALRLHNALSQGQKPEEYFAQWSHFDRLLALGDEELMRTTFTERYGKSEKNPEGRTAEEIDRTIEGMKSNGMLMLEAERLKDSLRQQKAARDKEASTYSGGAAREPDPKEVERFHKSIDTGIKEVIGQSKGTLYGLDLGEQASQERLAARVKYLLTPDPKKKGVSPFQEMLAKNNNMLRVAILADMAEQGVLSKMVMRKVEQAKDGIYKTLETRAPAAGGGNAGTDQGPDYSRLARPSGFA